MRRLIFHDCSRFSAATFSHAFAITFVILFTTTLTGCVSPIDRIAELRSNTTPLSFSVPEVEKVSLGNGSELYLKENHELPLVQFTLMTDGGALYEPVSKKGLTSLMAASMRSGGAGEMSPDQFDAEIEQLAADLYVSAGAYRIISGMTVQSKDLDRMLDLFFMMLKEPRFDDERLEISRSQMIDGVRRRNDRASSIAAREFNRTIYADHPMGQIATEETLSAITRSVLIDHHKKHFAGGFWIGVTGDFDRATLIDSLKSRLAGLSADLIKPSPIPSLSKREYMGQTILFDKDVSQTNIRIGMIGIDKNDPDFFPLQVANFILGGGGFNSRLMREIRSNRGLAYSVYSYFSIGRMVPGAFVVGCETKNESTAQVLEIIQQEIERIASEPVSSDELKLAKESMINSFIFAFDDQHEVLSRQMLLDYFDYPEGYMDNYRNNIASVTIDDILRVAKKRLKFSDMVTILTGPVQVAEQIDESTNIEVRIPE